MDMDDVKRFLLQHLFDAGGKKQSRRYGNADNGAAGMNWYRFTQDDDVSILSRLLGIGGGRNNLHLVSHAGEILLETGDMDIHPTGVSIIISGNEGYLHDLPISLWML